MDGELIEEEGVTYSAAVPTVWQMLLEYMQENGKCFTTLERVTIGGSACPESLIRIFRDDYGVEVIQGWGMTETSPLGTVSVPNASVADHMLHRPLPPTNRGSDIIRVPAAPA